MPTWNKPASPCLSSRIPSSVGVQSFCCTLAAPIPVSRSAARFQCVIRNVSSTKITASCMLSSSFSWKRVEAWAALLIGSGESCQNPLEAFPCNCVSQRRATPASADPWGGNTLEWSVSSPPPAYNFARIPAVRSRDPLWDGTSGPNGWALTDGRETLGSTVLDGEPEEILVMPEESFWPLGTALCVAAAFVGVLLDSAVVAIAAVVAVGLLLAGWLWRTQPEPAT